MKNETANQRHGSNNSCIRFPPPDPSLKLDLRPGQTVTINGITATIQEAPNGLLEITNADFIQQLRWLGFIPGYDETTTRRLERIVGTIVPAEFQQLYLDEFRGR